ncbi:MAG: PhoH family protein [Spirochaetota bacterium]
MELAVQDQSTMRELCGIGDENLKYIEQLTGTQVYVRGNVIEIPDSLSHDQTQRVRNLIQSSIELIQSGYALDSYQIKLLHDELTHHSEKSPEELMQHIIKRLNGQYSIEIGGKSIVPKSENQRQYMQSMIQEQVVFGVGPAGTGKTFLAIAKALEQLQNGQVHKVVLTRPVVEAGENLGYLPGDLSQKIAPYLRPLYDAMEVVLPLHTIRKMEENGVIEIAPLAYMRGRSLQQAFIILDEAQNTTREQMKMFLTRLGFGAQAVITGDITQIDLPSRKKSGLIHASELLNDTQGIDVIYFNSSDVVRSALVKRIIDAYENE